MVQLRNTYLQKKPKHIRIGINDLFPKAGDYTYVLDECGLSAKKIAEKICASF